MNNDTLHDIVVFALGIGIAFLVFSAGIMFLAIGYSALVNGCV